MIVELIFKPFILLIDFIISLIPNGQVVSGSFTNSFYDLVSLGLYFFGSAPFVGSIVYSVGWALIHITWAIIEWTYKKIPGIS